MPGAGLEPARPKSEDFKSPAYTNFATPAGPLTYQTRLPDAITGDLRVRLDLR